MDSAKRLAASAAFDLVENGMCLALGTGSTVEAGLERLVERVRSGLGIVCLSSSERTTRVARAMGLEIAALEEVAAIDLLIDGADQIADDLSMIKGRGGAHAREKKLAVIARKRIYAAEATKRVPSLGNIWLPLEVLPFGSKFTLASVAAITGGEVRFRLVDDGRTAMSDNGNCLADAWIGTIPQPHRLDRDLKMISGIVETGLFVGLADLVITSDGLSIRQERKNA